MKYGEIRVEMESNASPILVVIDQRDVARLEVQDIPESALITRVRFLAWSAMTRQQLTTLPWDKWQNECISAQDASAPQESTEEQSEEDEESLDPGRQPVSGGR